MTKAVILRQADGSVSATLPRDMADRLHLETGDQMFVVETDHGILLTPYSAEEERSLEAATHVAQRFEGALRELAK